MKSRVRYKQNFSLVFILCLGVSSSAFAVDLTESFDSVQRKESSTAVWNFELGQLHPPLYVNDYFNASNADFLFDVGDGRHGAFTEERYKDFSQNGDISGKVIRLNTNTFPHLYVSKFELKAGWTLKPEGSRPLQIHSLSNIIIEGTVDCSGDHGGSIDADNTLVRPGGIGRCGGGHGGRGATLTLAAHDGFSGGETIVDGAGAGVDGPTAGTGSLHAGLGAGGGGGGSYQTVGIFGHIDSSDGSGAGGLRGEMAPSHDFLVEGSGFGGGGGDYATDSAGGGGGAGGGSIYFFAVQNIDVYPTGKVLANGGHGGGGASGFLAGGGGGGGGGSILMFAGGDVRLAGPVDALAGSGGSDAGGVGGSGGDGRTWVVGSSGPSLDLPPFPVRYELPNNQLSPPGTVMFRSDAVYEASSTVIDLFNTKPILSKVVADQTLPAGSTIAIEWSTGDTPDFVPAVWNEITSEAEVKRYIRFRVQMSNSDEVNPAVLRSIILTYTPYFQTEFGFKGGCGLIQGSGSFPSNGGWILFSLLLPLLLIVGLKRRLN